MPCIVVLLALLTPRLVMFFIWLLTTWFWQAYGATWIWPLLGFFFMPYTTLAYMAAMLNAHGISGGWLVLLIVAIIVDLGHFEVSWRGRYRYRSR